ncbi:MAG: flagellar basal body rod protein FlgB [Sporolactobacillus sp.]
MFEATPLNAIEQAMNRSMAQQNVISQNIANVDTPNYKAKQVAFDDVFEQAMNDPSDGEADYHIVNGSGGTVQANGNNVDIDTEMTTLAKNQIYYQALSQAASNQFLQFNAVLSGGSN